MASVPTMRLVPSANPGITEGGPDSGEPGDFAQLLARVPSRSGEDVPAGEAEMPDDGPDTQGDADAERSSPADAALINLPCFQGPPFTVTDVVKKGASDLASRIPPPSEAVRSSAVSVGTVSSGLAAGPGAVAGTEIALAETAGGLEVASPEEQIMPQAEKMSSNVAAQARSQGDKSLSTIVSTSAAGPSPLPSASEATAATTGLPTAIQTALASAGGHALRPGAKGIAAGGKAGPQDVGAGSPSDVVPAATPTLEALFRRDVRIREKGAMTGDALSLPSRAEILQGQPAAQISPAALTAAGFTITADTAAAPAAMQAPTPMPGSAEAMIERQLDVAVDGEWLDQIARDIAGAGGSDGRMRFRLNPEHLGALQIELMQGDDGTSIRLTTESEAARAIIAEAQPRLVAEARAQGVRISETHVDLAGGQAGDPRRQEEERRDPILRTARHDSTDAEAADDRPTSSDRYA